MARVMTQRNGNKGRTRRAQQQALPLDVPCYQELLQSVLLSSASLLEMLDHVERTHWEDRFRGYRDEVAALRTTREATEPFVMRDPAEELQGEALRNEVLTLFAA